MSDRLEEFVRQHREQFDRHEPDPSLWLKIQTDAPTQAEKKAQPMRWLRIAAAVAMIFAGSAAGIYYLSGPRGEAGPYSELFVEMQETEQYYARVMEERYAELRPYLAADPQAEEMLQADMDELDTVYRELKEDLKDNMANPEVVEAMILNYRVKLEILEDLLYQLKEKENQDEKDESVSL
jgi:hypothetical protein